ncbi:SDR family oxidoreductase [Streptomyces sp. NPDC087850]|uniref:SDR family oxidoreductase n=1 Tax=Streptomyces sp. NPDC087850 TaxID=3365809 RepID=UPI0037FCC372
MDLSIGGRTAAIAGASGGLGYAAARALAEEGVRVVICGRDKERLTRAVEKLGDGVSGILADVSTPEGATDFVRRAHLELGRIDILVTNAGGPPAGTFATTELDAYAPALALNLLSVVAMCKEAVPGMQARGWGRVVGITSIAVRQPLPSLILSNTARAGATAFLKTLATEVARDGVTVNSLLPAYHDTDRVRSLHGDRIGTLGAELPVGRIGRPEEFGAFLAFLCGEQSGFLTGNAFPVDGGFHLGLF